MLFFDISVGILEFFISAFFVWLLFISVPVREVNTDFLSFFYHDYYYYHKLVNWNGLLLYEVLNALFCILSINWIDFLQKAVNIIEG